jgi:hypothetical protein
MLREPVAAELSVAGGILGSVRGEIPRSLNDQARWQAGVVIRKQAIDAGMTPNAIKWKIKSGVWRQVYIGVYVTYTGPLTRDAQLWAAVLFAGRGARISHETAAEIQRLTESRSPLIHVTIPADRRVRPPRGVAIHRSDRDVESAHGLPAASKQVPFTKPDGSRGRRDRCYEKYGLIVELDGKRYHPMTGSSAWPPLVIVRTNNCRRSFALAGAAEHDLVPGWD